MEWVANIRLPVIHELGEENSTTGTDLQGMQANPDLNYAG